VRLVVLCVCLKPGDRWIGWNSWSGCLLGWLVGWLVGWVIGLRFLMLDWGVFKEVTLLDGLGVRDVIWGLDSCRVVVCITGFIVEIFFFFLFFNFF
jgi:hypothetical protein